MPEAPKISVAPKAGETDAAKLNNITATFGAMTFNKSHLSTEAGTNKDYAKTYTYTVKEVAPTTGAIDKLRYSKAEYQVAVTVKAVMNETTGKYTGLTTSTTVTQMKDDMGNTLGKNGQGVAVQTSAGADPTIIPVSTFTNTYSTSLPLSGMSGVTLTYLAGAAVLCAAAAGCTFVARRMRREVSVVNKKFAPSRSCLRCLPSWSAPARLCSPLPRRPRRPRPVPSR